MVSRDQAKKYTDFQIQIQVSLMFYAGSICAMKHEAHMTRRGYACSFPIAINTLGVVIRRDMKYEA